VIQLSAGYSTILHMCKAVSLMLQPTGTSALGSQSLMRRRKDFSASEQKVSYYKRAIWRFTCKHLLTYTVVFQ
jgi:hypothetical protein